MGHLQPVANRILARVAVQGHHEPTAILVAELKGDIPSVQAASDRAGARLGQLAQEIAADNEAVVLTRRGEAVAVLNRGSV